MNFYMIYLGFFFIMIVGRGAEKMTMMRSLIPPPKN
eukprot:CAMPEP_0170550548 /NCGR_PEP_ID=MMETSP0211-20121228/8611_1 /TAXON_ID=311385 /ORGANISM="Pseudokeronopsis sp., Strain OXSARD2" /LENGTH=35 /DNA_ID= /DNA_START= /DNA_END= /DNA_ORIENTATION=